MWLFMGSRLFWSAPAERRGYTRRGDGAFPWPQRLCLERCIAKSKAAAGGCSLADPVVTLGHRGFQSVPG